MFCFFTFSIFEEQHLKEKISHFAIDKCYPCVALCLMFNAYVIYIHQNECNKEHVLLYLFENS